MTMNFITIKQSIIENVLGPFSGVKFNVVGFQSQSRNASETLDLNRTVQVFFSSSEFPRSSGRNTGPVQNKVTYRVELTASSTAKGDLSVVNNPGSTPAQISAAIAAFQESSDLVDALFDDFAEQVYQILMDGENYDMGLDKGIVSSRWIERVEKDQPEPRGQYVVLTGSMLFTLNTSEDITGATGTPASEYESIIDIDGDDVEKTGVAGTLGG